MTAGREKKTKKNGRKKKHRQVDPMDDLRVNQEPIGEFHRCHRAATQAKCSRCIFGEKVHRSVTPGFGSLISKEQVETVANLSDGQTLNPKVFPEDR